MKATITTKSNTTLKVTGTDDLGSEHTMVLDFATMELARDAYWGLQDKGLKIEVKGSTVRYCDAQQAIADTLSFFCK